MDKIRQLSQAILADKTNARPYPLAQGSNPLLPLLRDLLRELKAYLNCEDVAYTGSVGLWLQGVAPAFDDIDVWTATITTPVGIPGMDILFQPRHNAANDIALGMQYLTRVDGIDVMSAEYILGCNYVFAQYGHPKARLCTRPNSDLLAGLHGVLGLQSTLAQPEEPKKWLSGLECHCTDLRYARDHWYTDMRDTVDLLREIQRILKNKLKCNVCAYAGSVGLYLQGVTDNFGDLDVFTDRIYEQGEIEERLALPMSARTTVGWQVWWLSLDIFFAPSNRSQQHLLLGLPHCKQLDTGIWVQDAEYIQKYNYTFLRGDPTKARKMVPESLPLDELEKAGWTCSGLT